MVWNTFVQNKIIEKEVEALGLTVTDAEIQKRAKGRYKPNAYGYTIC